MMLRISDEIYFADQMMKYNKLTKTNKEKMNQMNNHSRFLSLENFSSNENLNKNYHNPKQINNQKRQHMPKNKEKNKNNNRTIKKESLLIPNVVEKEDNVNRYLNYIKNMERKQKTSENQTKTMEIKKLVKKNLETQSKWRLNNVLTKQLDKNHNDLYKLIKQKEIPQQIEKILFYYKYLKDYGYSDLKICNLIRRISNGKTQIESIFLKIKSDSLYSNQLPEYQYQANKNQIYTSIINTILKKNMFHIEQFLYNIFEYKQSLENQIIFRGLTKISNVTDSIVKKKADLLNTENAFKKSLSSYGINVKQKGSTIKMFTVQDELQEVEHKYGLFKKISIVNRKLYEYLHGTQNEINNKVREISYNLKKNPSNQL